MSLTSLRELELCLQLYLEQIDTTKRAPCLFLSNFLPAPYKGMAPNHTFLLRTTVIKQISAGVNTRIVTKFIKFGIS